MSTHQSRMFLSALALLGLSRCSSEKVIVLDLPVWPGNAVSLGLRSTLDGTPGKDLTYSLGTRRIAVYLPDAAVGPVALNLIWTNFDKCAVANAALKADVPSGLSGLAEYTVNPSPLSPPVCFETLTAGTQLGGSVVAAWGSDADNVYVLGSNGNMFRCSAGTTICTDLASGTTQFLNAVWGSDAAHVYAVGDNGSIVQCSAGSNACTPLNSNTSVRFYSVWADGANVYAAGEGGVVRCAVGSNTCTKLTTGTSSYFMSVWGSDAANVYAVGGSAGAVRCAAGSNTCTPLTLSISPYAVWGSDAANVYVVGAGGGVVRCAAASNTCTTLTVGVSSYLNAVWGSDAANVYAVGQNGAVVRCAAGSNTCTPLNSGTTQDLISVSGSDAAHVYAVSHTGVVVRCASTSNSCTPVTTEKVSPYLRSVWGSDATGVYITGDGYTLLRSGY